MKIVTICQIAAFEIEVYMLASSSGGGGLPSLIRHCGFLRVIYVGYLYIFYIYVGYQIVSDMSNIYTKVWQHFT